MLLSLLISFLSVLLHEAIQLTPNATNNAPINHFVLIFSPNTIDPNIPVNRKLTDELITVTCNDPLHDIAFKNEDN